MLLDSFSAVNLQLILTPAKWCTLKNSTSPNMQQQTVVQLQEMLVPVLLTEKTTEWWFNFPSFLFNVHNLPLATLRP